MDANFLVQFLTSTKEKDWCMKVFCGTCRAIDFRSNLLAAAAKEAGIKRSVPFRADPQIFLPSLPMEDRKACLVTIASALKNISPEQVDSMDPIRLILVELNYSGFNQVVGQTLDEFMEGSWPGEILSSMRKHFENLMRHREEKAKFHSPECVKERRDRRQENHSKRIDAKAGRDQHRQDILKKLENMAPVDRLASIAASDSLRLDAIPSALVPHDSTTVNRLGSDIALRLKEKIGQRSGHWRKLANVLKVRLSEP